MPTPTELERALAGKECMNCQTVPRVVHAGAFGGPQHQGQYTYRCNCGLKDGWPVEPVLVKEEHGIARRYRKMTNAQIARSDEKGIVKYESLGREVALNYKAVCEKFPDAEKNGLTQNEAYIFMQFCKGYGLNPFINEAYLMKPQNSAAAIMVAVQAYVNRAEIHPMFDGMESGLVIVQNDEEREIAGEIVPTSAKAIGGWCKVYRKDRRIPTHVRLPLDAWNKKRNLWNENPNHMIVVRCVGHAMKQALPDLLGRYAELTWPESEEPIAIERVDEGSGALMEATVEYMENEQAEGEIRAETVAERVDASRDHNTEDDSGENSGGVPEENDSTDLLLYAAQLGIDEKTAGLIVSEAADGEDAMKRLQAHAAKRK